MSAVFACAVPAPITVDSDSGMDFDAGIPCELLGMKNRDHILDGMVEFMDHNSLCSGPHHVREHTKPGE